MALVIVNKKVFSIFIITTITIVGGISFGLYSLFFHSEKNKELNDKNNNSVLMNDQRLINVTEPEKVNENEKTSTTSEDKDINLTENNPAKNKLIEYNNQKYEYSVSFSEKWNVNVDSSENDFKQIELNEGNKFFISGQTFWSNYKNINEFSPTEKPSDFRLLSLAVYKNDSPSTIEEFAQIAGFYIDEVSQKIPFATKHASGFEFFTPGLSKENPKISIIFQKENNFYVFTLAFTNSDPAVILEMEEIVKGFKMK